MNNIKLAVHVLVFLALSMAIPASAREAIERLAIGDGEIIVLADSFGQSKASTFPDINNYPECAELFRNGPRPSIVRVFYLERGDKKILIDSGWGLEQPEAKGILLDLLREINVDAESITDIALTHMDFDHLGGLVKEQSPVFPNASLWISRPEFEAWRAGEISKRPAGKLEFANNTIDLYKDRIKLFDFGSQILPGVTALDSIGHTPGHAAYEIADGDDKIEIVGDSIISEAQMLKPELYSIHDMDPDKAGESRANLLKFICDNNAALIGMHLDRYGKISTNKNGGYIFQD